MTTLGYALLGLLARQSLSGYDLARLMKVPVGFFWYARHSQIYPELARLEASGHVTYEVVEQQDRPDKKLYSITEVGREALRRWVTEPADMPTVRDELVLRAFCVWLADPPAAATLFREHQRLHAERLAGYEARQRDLQQCQAGDLRVPSSPAFAAFVALRRGIGYEREYAEWCGWVAALLESSVDCPATLETMLDTPR